MYLDDYSIIYVVTRMTMAPDETLVYERNQFYDKKSVFDFVADTKLLDGPRPPTWRANRGFLLTAKSCGIQFRSREILSLKDLEASVQAIEKRHRERLEANDKRRRAKRLS